MLVPAAFACVGFDLQCLSSTSSPESRFSTAKSSFTLKFKDETSPYRIIGVFVLPAETLSLEVLDSDENSRFASEV